MGSKQYLTTDLNHLPKPRLLEPGETLIVRFKNSLRSYKSDIWIGVVLPISFGPSQHLHRRPVGSQPLEGEWLTHLKDRIYSMYLPARNMYRWVGLSDIYVLDEKTPNVLRRAERQPDAKIWDDLREIIRTDPGLEFWKDMALQEQGAKGTRGKKLRIILPSGHEDLIPGGESDIETESGTKDENKANNENRTAALKHPGSDTDLSPGPSKVQATVKSFSESRVATGLQSAPRTTHSDSKPICPSTASVSFTPNTGQKPRFIPKLPPFQCLTPSNSYPISSLSIPASSTMNQDMQSSSTSAPADTSLKVEGDASPGVTNPAVQETNSPSSIFNMPLSQALEHIVLGHNDRDQIIDVFRGAVVVDTQPEYVHIRSYLQDGDFLPRVVELDSPEFKFPTQFPTRDANNNEVMRVVGDQMAIGQNYKLLGISTNEDLEQIIVILGRVYLQARRFGLNHMVYRAAFKLQIAWNCYPYLYQCKPLLEVAALAFDGCTDFATGACDYLQRLLIHLLAEAMDLFTYTASKQFWDLMEAHPNAREEVLQLRFQAHCVNPEVYGNTRALLASRGVL